MINILNSWIKGIIIAVIITIIIEMILPEGSNKKYIKTVINLYILYVIIAPVCSKILHKKIDLNAVFASYKIPEVAVNTIDSNIYIKEDYEKNLEQTIKENIDRMGFNVSEIKVYISEKDESYGMLEKIRIVLIKAEDNTIKKIEKINLRKNEEEVEEKSINEEDRRKITEYLITNYGVKDENIIIIGG